MEKKLSEKLWEKNTANAETQSGAKIEYFDGYKPTYDKILSLEAKIEELKILEYHRLLPSVARIFIAQKISSLESDLQQIAKEENL